MITSRSSYIIYKFNYNHWGLIDIFFSLAFSITSMYAWTRARDIERHPVSANAPDASLTHHIVAFSRREMVNRDANETHTTPVVWHRVYYIRETVCSSLCHRQGKLLSRKSFGSVLIECWKRRTIDLIFYVTSEILHQNPVSK